MMAWLIRSKSTKINLFFVKASFPSIFKRHTKTHSLRVNNAYETRLKHVENARNTRLKHEEYAFKTRGIRV
jgi:hypothetical protein